MTATQEKAALVALLKAAARPWHEYADAIEQHASALAVLEAQRGLFAGDELDDAAAQLAGWERSGLRLLTVLDPDYPENLHTVYDRPPLIFVSGSLQPSDARSVAVVGTRRASVKGRARAQAIAEHLASAGYTVVSGLAAGIDTAAHATALRHGGRTVAVIGTGLRRTYPAANAELQRRIARDCAVVSQFWPDSPPTSRSFLARNATMSGLALGTVVVEASRTSGARAQARFAIEHGRPVFLPEPLLEEAWAREFADRPGTHVVQYPDEITAVIERLNAPGALVP
ncbi:MAG: DNA-processing protein DprA [Solirubrobacteraceae bacterium]